MAKILILTNVFGRPWNLIRGPYNQIIFDGLDKTDEISVLVPVTLAELFKNVRQVVPALLFGNSRWPYARYFIYLHIPRVSQSFNAALMALSVALRFPYRVFVKRWDCMFASWLYPDAVALGMIARMRRVPLVAHAIGSDVNVVAKLPLQQAQILKVLSNCRAVVTVSKDLGRQLATIGFPESTLKVVYNGVDSKVFQCLPQAPNRSKRGLDPDRRVILFVGSLLKAKGVFELLAAFHELTREDPGTVLVLVGGGPEHKNILREAERLGLADRVLLPGVFLHADLAEWYNAADVMCLPSHMEGVPNVIMESMACGVPVVATDVGGVKEVLNERVGILVEPRNVPDLLRGLRKALGQTWNRDEIRAEVISFTWERTIDEVRGLLVHSDVADASLSKSNC